ncbi:MAG TPA: dephospho-CoA kinase [Burkholderiaceae bacterium]|jgi:dephospho-CoA kinase
MASTAFSVGLTGGIGSGKTMVANMFGAKGAAVIDTDQIAHQLTKVGGSALPAIRAQFGEDFLTPEGAMDRTKMREHVFADPAAKKRLESILHPLIRMETAHAAKQANGNYLLFVVPLLIESGTWKDQVSRILVVDCPEELQVKRVVQRSGLSESQVRAIMATQATRELRRAAADDIILNDGDATLLMPEIDRLHTLYTSLAKAADAPHSA